MSESFTPFPGNPPGGPSPRAGVPPAGGVPGGGPPLSAGPTSGLGPPRGPSSVVAQPPASTGRRSDGKKEKKPTKRTISRNLLLTIVFAVLAAGVVLFILSDEVEERYVVRALNDIPAGTAVAGSLLEAAPLPQGAIEPNTFVSDTAEEALAAALEELDGTVTQYPLPAKTQLRSDQFGLQATLGQELAPNERLVSIRATVSTAVAGGLMAGDHVDIVGAADGFARVVAYDVPIMSVTASEERYDSISDAQEADRELSPDEALPAKPVPGIYVVKVPAEVVPTLLNWNESATLNLVYRGADAISVPLPDSLLDDEELEFFENVGEEEELEGEEGEEVDAEQDENPADEE